MRVLEHALQLLQLLALLGADGYSVLQLLDPPALGLQLVINLIEQALQVSKLTVDLGELMIPLLQNAIALVQLLRTRLELALHVAHLRPDELLQVGVSLLCAGVLVLGLDQAPLERGCPARGGGALHLFGSQELPSLMQRYSSLAMLSTKRSILLAKPADLALGAVGLRSVPCSLSLSRLAQMLHKGLVGLLQRLSLGLGVLQGKRGTLVHALVQRKLPLLQHCPQLTLVHLRELYPLVLEVVYMLSMSCLELGPELADGPHGLRLGCRLLLAALGVLLEALSDARDLSILLREAVLLLCELPLRGLQLLRYGLCRD
mmetsp:Transcript_73127/g.218193  ORF Transcript_73127/g.218193 Transcript_73127/m.218193 type:complete len:317 (+) Transcript_73127:297-1247(+)